MSNVFISAGHHPAKPGACFGDFCEHAEAYAWAVTVTDMLIRDGHLAHFVPVGVLRDKTAFINAGDPLLAVEIHFNSFKIWEDANRDGIVTSDELHNAGSGSETLYYPESSIGAFFANNIQAELATVFPPNRGAKPGWYRMNPKFGPDYFLAKTTCPAVIVEPEFIHKKNLIQNNREDGCRAIVRGILATIEGL